MAILRFFTVYGPGGLPDMSIFRFVQRISEGLPVIVYGDGTQERDFTYVEDAAQAAVSVLRPTGFEIINVGSDKPVTLMDAIHLIEGMVGRKANLVFEPRHQADLPATWANIAKAEKLLNWRPRVDFMDGLRRVVTWYQANRDWLATIETDRA